MTPAIMSEDEPGRAGVRAVEAGLALEPLRRVLQADDREHDEGDQHGAGEEVLDRPDPVPGPDEREVEGLLEERPVGLDDRDQQDGEAPHGEEVGQPRHRPLQQLALAGDLGGLGLRLGHDAAPGPVGVLLPRADELGQPVEPAGGDPEADDGDGKAQDDSDRHECSSSLVTAGLLRTWEAAECERHLGFQCGPEDSGAVTRGRSSGPTACQRAPATPVGCPWRAASKPGRSGWSRRASSAMPNSSPTGRATPCNKAPACHRSCHTEPLLRPTWRFSATGNSRLPSV